MSNCCSSNNQKQRRAAVAACPTCGIKGKALPTLTVKHLVVNHTHVATDESYAFCRTPRCEVVYFAPGCVFGKADLKVRVGLKEQADSATLCYYLGYTRDDIRGETQQRSSTDIPTRIQAEIQARFAPARSRIRAERAVLGTSPARFKN